MTGQSRIYSPPRPGSRAHHALASLHRFGGRADLRTWMTACSWSESIREFEQVIIARLQYVRLVDVDADGYQITSAGIEQLGLDADAPPAVAPVVATSRTFVSDRALSSKHMVRMPLMREGALDYLSIPSRIGDRAMPHQVACSLATGSCEQ